VNILLVDDHRMVLEGIRLCLEERDDIEVVAEASDGQTAVLLARDLKPDVVVMDITLPKLNGPDSARQILHDSQGRTKVLFLSMHSDREFVLEAFRAGASGYVVKSSSVSELLQALDEIAAGRKYLSPAVADVVIDDFINPASPVPQTTLTPRQRHVLRLLAKGKTAKQIAAELDLSHKTIHAFRSQIMAKLGVKSLAELTMYALRMGLITMD